MMVWVRYYIYKAFNDTDCKSFHHSNSTTQIISLYFCSITCNGLFQIFGPHPHSGHFSWLQYATKKKKKPFFSFFLWFLNSLSFGSYSKKVDEPRFDKVQTPNSVFLTHRWRSLASQNNVIPWCCVIVLNLAMRVVVIVIAPLLHFDPGIWWTIMCIATLILVIRVCFVAAVGWYNFHFVACFWAYVNKISLLETYK